MSVKASDDEFSEMVSKPLEIGHFLRDYLRVCMHWYVFDLTEMLLIKIGFKT